MHMDKNGKEFGYMKYDSRPTVCKCGGKVIYGRMKDFGITPYKSGYCYFCTKCGAYVGTHENRKKDALGVLSDGRTRRMRMVCHQEFDKHWDSTAGKNRLYFKLSKELGIKSEDCHFGYMDYEQLQKALNIMQSWGDFKIR